jgi:hypothetical protein
MGAVHSIEGLIKLVRRDEWRGSFVDVFQRHVGQACCSAGIELDELAESVSDHGVSNLRCCAFEYFVSSGLDERNVAIDYLKRPGRKESPAMRAYIEALRRSTMRPYEVSDIPDGWNQDLTPNRYKNAARGDV